MSKLNRPPVWQDTKNMVDSNAKEFQSNENGEIISPNNTGQVVGDDAHYGHRPGFENKSFVANAEKAGYSQEELNSVTNNAGLYQKEPSKENMSHKYEEKDLNQANLNTYAYMVSKDKELASRTYINIDSDAKHGHLSVVNKETGVESNVGNFSLSDSNEASLPLAESNKIQKVNPESTTPTKPQLKTLNHDVINPEHESALSAQIDSQEQISEITKGYDLVIN